jgi:hypothetical protein
MLATPHGWRRALPSFLPHSEPMKPHGRISRIAAADNRDPKIGDRQQTSPNRIGVAGTVVDVRALDEQEGKRCCVSDSAYLRPKTTTTERAVKIRDRFSLDQRTARDSVVACGQRFDDDLCSKSLQARGNPASFLEDVRDDGRAGILVHDL